MFSIATKFSPEAANFEKAVFADYECAELHLTPLRLMSWRSLSKIARSYDLEYALHFPTGDKSTVQTCEEVVELCRDISCDLITVHEENLDVANTISALDPSIRLAVENQNVSFGDLDEWIQSHDFVTLNIEHLWKHTLLNCERNELVSVVNRLMHNYRDRIRHVHLSGYTADQPTRRPIHLSQDFSQSLLDVFLQEEYDGFVVWEIDTEFQTGELLRKDMDWYQSWRSQKGMPRLLDSRTYLGTQNQVQ